MKYVKVVRRLPKKQDIAYMQVEGGYLVLYSCENHRRREYALLELPLVNPWLSLEEMVKIFTRESHKEKVFVTRKQWQAIRRGQQLDRNVQDFAYHKNNLQEQESVENESTLDDRIAAATVRATIA